MLGRKTRGIGILTLSDVVRQLFSFQLSSVLVHDYSAILTRRNGGTSLLMTKTELCMHVEGHVAQHLHFLLVSTCVSLNLICNSRFTENATVIQCEDRRTAGERT